MLPDFYSFSQMLLEISVRPDACRCEDAIHGACPAAVFSPNQTLNVSFKGHMLQARFAECLTWEYVWWLLQSLKPILDGC